MEAISAEQFVAWKNDPVTELFMDKLYTEREDMKEGLANSVFDNEEDVKGRCRALYLILEMEYKDLMPSSFVVLEDGGTDD